MSGVNKVILIGYLGKDPEIHQASSGDAIANFSLATSEEWKAKDTGEKKQKTEWHRIVAFKRLAEICGEYLSKGSQVYVEGRLQARSWEDKEGVTKHTTEIVASTVQFLGGKGSAGSRGDSKRQPDAQKPKSDAMDDIPF